MNVVWAQSVLFAPPRVLGKPLRGFSPFHALVLEAVHSPYMDGGTAGFDDLLLAVWICSHGWEDRFAIMSDMAAVSEWGKTISEADAVPARRDFSAYLSESFKSPQFWDAPGGKACRAHWAFHLASFGMEYLNLSEAEAWDTPIARLVCYRACMGERNGDDSLISEEELRGMDILQSESEKEKANGTA